MAAIAHKQLLKSRGRPLGLVRSPDGGMRVTSSVAPLPAATVSQPLGTIHTIPRLA